MNWNIRFAKIVIDSLYIMYRILHCVWFCYGANVNYNNEMLKSEHLLEIVWFEQCISNWNVC